LPVAFPVPGAGAEEVFGPFHGRDVIEPDAHGAGRGSGVIVEFFHVEADGGERLRGFVHRGQACQELAGPAERYVHSSPFSWLTTRRSPWAKFLTSFTP